MKKTTHLIFLVLFLSANFFFATKSTLASNAPSKLNGKILLQVESKGEAWYVSPSDGKRYSMGKPNDAFELMRNLGVGISNDNLKKIQIANENLIGQDNDSDGLSNMVEDSIGTNKSDKDSDGDGFDDKSELINGYNIKGPGKISIDINFSKQQAGKILLQVEGKGEAWYVNPNDNKRYFLGRSSDAFNLMRKLGLGVSNNNLNKIGLAVSPKITISKNNEMLKEISIIEQNPLSDKANYAKITKFADESNDVIVSVSSDIFNWLDAKTDLILLGAYIAGNIKPQLEKMEKKDHVYDGLAFMINAYVKIKSTKSDYYLAGAENILKIKNEGKLLEYVKNPKAFVSQPKANNQTEDGLGFATAITVTATTETTGIPREYDWLETNACKNNSGYIGYSKQISDSNDGHNYDIIVANCADGKNIDYYFMIDNYLGKW